MTRLAHVLATWFGCGLSPIAPGTVGTLAALPLWWLSRGSGAVAVLGAAAIVTAIGIWASGIVATASRTKDPQRVVIDEVAGVLVALGASPQDMQSAVIAVVLFRVFDILKPFPARRAERLPGGWGIMLDDVVAGIQAALVVRLVVGAAA